MWIVSIYYCNKYILYNEAKEIFMENIILASYVHRQVWVKTGDLKQNI